MGETDNWIERLEEEFQWSDNEPGPERVVEEAKKREIDSIDHLIDRMEDASEVPNNISKILEESSSEGQLRGVQDDLSGGAMTGYMRWKWYREYRDSFLGNPCDDE